MYLSLIILVIDRPVETGLLIYHYLPSQTGWLGVTNAQRFYQELVFPKGELVKMVCSLCAKDAPELDFRRNQLINLLDRGPVFIRWC